MPEQNQAVNLKELKEIMSDDMELITECFQDFITEWPAQYIDIKDAVVSKKAGKLDDAAHKLKGTLKYLAAENAANAAYALESAGKSSDFTGIDQKLKQLETECKRLVEYIRCFNP